jgi:hypothetical protein
MTHGNRAFFINLKHGGYLNKVERAGRAHMNGLTILTEHPELGQSGVLVLKAHTNGNGNW